jgi:trimethylamine--corrinoid protein Co-methyltransferase
MRPTLQFLDTETIDRVVNEAYDLLRDPGVRVHSDEGLALVSDAGAYVDAAKQTARIPASLIDRCLETVPSEFWLHDAEGQPVVHYGGDDVHFDPGSAAIEILDYSAVESRKPVTADFVRYVKLTEMLSAMDAISTAMVCADVPQQIADLYRLYLILLHARKPIVTGAFDIQTWHVMYELLVTVAGSSEALAAKPLAVFDVCPSPPLLWSEITCQNLIDCARNGVPAELVSMPLAGANGPATLIGSVVQHTAECLSGIVIHQLATPGSPIVWGGSPAIFDMRVGAPPMGAIETMMIDCAYAEVGKFLGLPTHTYMGVSDSKIVDTQTGFESGIGAVLGALAGINMISGPGLLDFESCFSLEKLVIDAEIVGMARRLIRGIHTEDTETRRRRDAETVFASPLPPAPVASLGVEVIRQVGHAGKFLATKHTREWFRREQFIPSPVINRSTRQAWLDQGAKTTAQRAHAQVEALISAYEPKPLTTEVARELEAVTLRAATAAGMATLPKHHR